MYSLILNEQTVAVGLKASSQTREVSSLPSLLCWLYWSSLFAVLLFSLVVLYTDIVVNKLKRSLFWWYVYDFRSSFLNILFELTPMSRGLCFILRDFIGKNWHFIFLQSNCCRKEDKLPNGLALITEKTKIKGQSVVKTYLSVASKTLEVRLRIS